MDKSKNKNIFYYLNHKHLIGEIEQYGYVITAKKLIIMYVLVVAASILSAYLFKLTATGYVIICASALILTPRLLLYSYRAMYEQRRFSDASKYIEKMLYYFKANKNILTALKNAEIIFHDGIMKQTINEAIDYIRNQDDSKLSEDILTVFKNEFSDTGKRNVEEKALRIIELKYPNKRIRQMHKFFLTVEKNGGNPDLGIEMQLKERERWTSEVVTQQKERSNLRKYFVIFSVLMIILCLSFLYIPIIYPVFGFDLSEYTMVRGASVITIVVTLVLYTKLNKSVSKSWLEEDKKRSDEEQAKRYYEIVNYNEKKELTKSLIYTLISVCITALLFIITSSKIILIAGGCISVFLACSYKIGYKLGKKDMAAELQEAFSEWIMQIALLMQFDNVPMSIVKSYDTAPGILKPEINKMLIALDEQPTSPVPFNDFLSFFNLPEVNEAMNALYSVMTAAGSDIDKELKAILERNRKLADKVYEMKQQDKSAANELYIYGEIAVGSLLMLVDSLYMMLSFMSTMGNLV